MKRLNQEGVFLFFVLAALAVSFGLLLDAATH
jgi:hypothetical protein